MVALSPESRGVPQVLVRPTEKVSQLDARGPEKLPVDNNLFDLIPASKLQLRDLRRRDPSVTGLS